MKIDVNGIQFNVSVTGQSEGPVVVLSHSLCTTLSMWDDQMATLETDFRVLRYDTRGHGASDAPIGAYTLEQLGDDVIGILNSLGIETVIWVGLSMGGMIGQSVALNYPERIEKMILSSTAARGSHPAADSNHTGDRFCWLQRSDTSFGLYRGSQ